MDINFIQGLKHTNKIEELKKKLCLGLIDNLGQPTDKESEYLISMISGEHNSLSIPSNRIETLMHFALVGGNIDLLEKPNSSWSRKEKYWYAVATGYKNDVIEPGAGCSKEDILDYWLALYSAIREWLEVTGTKIVIPNSKQGYSKELAVAGMTIQNLMPFNDGSFTLEGNKAQWENGIINVNATNTHYASCMIRPTIASMFKPNTQYTWDVDFELIDSVYADDTKPSRGCVLIFFKDNAVQFFVGLTENKIPVGSRKKYRVNFSTASLAPDRVEFRLLTADLVSPSKIIKGKIYSSWIIEGNQQDVNLPALVDGIESLGEKEGNKITVQSITKNRLNIAYRDGNNTTLDTYRGYKLTLDRNKSWVLSWKLKDGVTLPTGRLMAISTTINPNKGVFMTLFDASGKIFTPFIIGKDKINLDNSCYLTLYNGNSFQTVQEYNDFINTYIDYIQIEEGTVATTYQPYQANIVDWQLTEPLRSLPSGVIDEVDKTGLENRRIGKRVFKGGLDENWSVTGDFTTQYVRFSMNDTTIKPTSNANDISTISDRIQSISHSNIVSKSMEGVGIHNVSQQLNIVIDKAKLSTQDIPGFKAWLQANNVTVLYELATPTTKQLEKKNIQTFEGGTILECTNNAKGSIIATVPVKNTY